MWLHAECRLPYYADPDYRRAVVESVKQRFGDVVVDVTLLHSWGFFEVALGEEDMDALSKLPLVGRVHQSVDREMFLGVRVTM